MTRGQPCTQNISGGIIPTRHSTSKTCILSITVYYFLIRQVADRSAGVLDHLVPELRDPQRDWDVIIAHFLGVDHVGHRYGYVIRCECAVDTRHSRTGPVTPP
jgi:predicted AlkP superfamily pyrophosphatase or phosphodiesterase